MVGFDTGGSETSGNYLDLVYDDGSEIEHSARLEMTEYTFGARVRPLPEGRVSPYLAVGVSLASYRYSEEGAFVKPETSVVEYNEFSERLSLFGFFAGAGLDYALVRLPYGRRIDLFGEFRYARGESEHEDGFDGFGDLTIGRTGALFGLRIRF